MTYKNPIGYEAIEPADTATGITASIRVPTSGLRKGRDAIAALITNEGETARVCWDGTTPTNSADTPASVGIPLYDRDVLIVEGVTPVKNFLAIDAVSGSTSKLHVVTYFN